MHQGFVYARRIGDQILIGGGRHLNKVGEMTDEEGITSEIESYLLNFLRTHFDVPPDIRFVQSWSGIMGMGSEKMPIVRELEENIFAAVRLGGMGVAIGSLVGDNLAQLMLSQS
ncbi:MAG: FAD-binding oxidoreductase [Saprospiraceae bacterium]|nr:FAD-binding oxidoreductase [Saprospiraceae bacterium]